MSLNLTKRGMYFEEFKLGQKFVTSSRTITETDVVAFAGLSGDYNQIHMDIEYSRKGPFGRRVAHGLLILSIASGLAVQIGIMEGTVIAFREIKNWKFSKVVFIGDTIHVEMEVIDLKSLPRFDGGVVVIKISVINQNSEVVMRGIWSNLMVSEPSDS